MPSNELEGKVAIVTGAGSGLGTAIAESFVAEGAKVVISGRRLDVLEKTAAEIGKAGSGECLAVSGDVSKEDEVEALFERTVSEFGQLDILVNNAGIAGEVASIWEMSFEGWLETIAVNLSGPWLCSRAAAKLMIPRKQGKIVNIGSVTGKRPLAQRTPYTSSKMGLVGLTRTLALELGEYNINVNNLSPGAVDTPRLALLAEAWGVPLEKLMSDFSSLSALKRLPEPVDIANLAVFLASDRSRNITGMDITVDGGIWYS